ncbi:hypothetical protein HK102_007707 [Quaeritorhiza haematococci]|nr:hypothetical protein HK102_007707 [Quaeritorhiza haematococci]
MTDQIRDEDDIFAELEEEDDDEILALREKRRKQLEQELSEVRNLRQNNHGTYEDIGTEKDILQITTGTKLCVVHFYHKEFRRCQIMDKHLGALARKHFKTKFVKIDVEKAPFLVEKLKIQVLPCVIAFVDGISVDRYAVSFISFILSRRDVSEPSDRTRKTIFGFSEDRSEDEDDDD